LILRDPAAKAANAAADRFAADCRLFAPVADLDLSANKKPAAAIVFFACPARAAIQHRESFKDPLLLFGDEDAELATLLEGPGSDGFHVATAVDPTGTPERLGAFQRRFEEKHKQRPTTAAVLTYDAITVWAEAAHRNDELDAAAIRDQLLKRETPFEVLTGTLLFADDHTARRPVFVGRVAGGKLVDIKTYEPSPAK
jgi:ABC-type branched-subunit amino acid transport system substrate-binding protein